MSFQNFAIRIECQGGIGVSDIPPGCVQSGHVHVCHSIKELSLTRSVHMTTSLVITLHCFVVLLVLLLLSPAAMKRHFFALERCPYKEALHENTGNNRTDSCSNSRTSSPVTIILREFQLSPSGATSQ